jgi:hypothetical protein
MEDVNMYDISKIRIDKKPRPQQTELLNFTKQSILDNNKFIMIDAPVGIGKSIYAVMFMDWFKKNYDITATFDILTNSKILQEQYTNEFDFMNSLWGKGSYECEKYGTDCGTGMDWCKLQGIKCDSCPYSTSKYKFENGDVALTNFHLFLTYKMFMPNAWKRSSRVLIIDECLHPDTLITMYDDTQKKIKEVKPGDLVKTVNEKTMQIEIKPVVKQHYNLNKGQQMYEIEMEDGSIINITGNHKIKLTNGKWIKAEDLTSEEDILYIK